MRERYCNKRSPTKWGRRSVCAKLHSRFCSSYSHAPPYSRSAVVTVGDPREVVPGVGARFPGVAVAGAELIVTRAAGKAFRAAEVTTEVVPQAEAIPEGAAIPAVEL